MKGRRLFAIPPPLEGDEETLLVSFCIPNTHGWRSAATALLSQFDYGRAYDEDTGSILGALEVGREIFNSMSMCDLDEMTRAIRELTAVIGGQAVDFTQPIPDEVDYSNTAFGLLPMLHEHLQSLGPIPKAGDTIMTSLQKLVDTEGYDDRTIDEMIAAIQSLEPSLLSDFSDMANLLIAWKALFPGTANVRVVMGFFEKWYQKRWWHNHLTLQAYQATAQRGIMRALAPFDDDPESTEQEILNRLGSNKWLVKAAIAVAEPGPLGEVYLLADGIIGSIQKIFEVVKSAWQLWFDKWVNKIEDPTPTDNVTSAISSISAVLGGIGTEQPPLTPNPFFNLGAILADLSQSINTMATKCSFCGSAGGCGCDGGNFGNPAALPPPPDNFAEGEDVPDGWETLPDLPGSFNYQTRKCKVSNLVQQGVISVVSKIASKTSEIAAAKSLSHALGIAFMITVLSIGIGEVLTPLPVIDAVFVGSLVLAVSLATYLVSQDIVFAPLQAALTARQDDLVCALYNATSVGQAKSDYQAVLEDEGVNTISAGLTGIIISAGWAGLLFADIQGFGDQIAEALSGYTGAVDCDVCGETECLLTKLFGLTGQVVTEVSPGVWEVVAQQLNNPTRYAIGVGWNEGDNTKILEEISLISGSLTGGLNPNVYGQIYLDCTTGNNQYNGGSNILPGFNSHQGQRFRILSTAYSTTPHTLRIEVSGTCELYQSSCS